MAYRLVGAQPIQPTGYLKTTLPQRPTPFTGINQNNPRAAVLGLWGGGNNPNTRDMRGQLSPWGQQIQGYNQQLQGAMQSANAESPGYIVPNSIRNTQNMFYSGGGPTLMDTLVRGRLGTGQWVGQPTNQVIGQFGGQIPQQADYNTALQNAQLVRHTNVGGPVGGLSSLLGFALGLPGGLLSQFIGGLPAGLQTAAKVGGGLYKAYDLVNSKGRAGAGSILGFLNPSVPSHPGIR